MGKCVVGSLALVLIVVAGCDGEIAPASPVAAPVAAATNVPVVDAGARAEASASISSTGRTSGCTAEITGSRSAANNSGTTTQGIEQLAIDLDAIDLGCTFQTPDTRINQIMLDLPLITAPGTYMTTSATVYESCACDTRGDFDLGPCTVVVEDIALATHGWLDAHYDCPASNVTGSTSASATLAARGDFHIFPSPYAANDPTNGNFQGTGCTMSVTGAFTATATGYADQNQCAVEVDGIRYAIDLNFANETGEYPTEVDVMGSNWFARYDAVPSRGSHCVSQVTVNENVVGGRYAETFSCTGLVAGDGTSIGIEGKVDTKIVRED